LGHKKDKTPLTQVTTLTHESTSPTLIMTKTALEETILHCNQRHACQSLDTPFAKQPTLSCAIDHTIPMNKINQILEGTFLNDDADIPFSATKQQWINELCQGISEPMDTHITFNDLIQYFKRHKE